MRNFLLALTLLPGCATITGTDGRPCSGLERMTHPERCGTPTQVVAFAHVKPCEMQCQSEMHLNPYDLSRMQTFRDDKTCLCVVGEGEIPNFTPTEHSAIAKTYWLRTKLIYPDAVYLGDPVATMEFLSKLAENEAAAARVCLERSRAAVKAKEQLQSIQ